MNQKLFLLTKKVVLLLPVVVNLLFAMTGIVYYFTGVNLSPHWYALFGHSVAFSALLLLLSILFKNCAWHQVLCVCMLTGIILEELSAEGLINISLSFYLSAGLAIFGLIISAILRLGWIRFIKASLNRFGTSPDGLTTGTVRHCRMKSTSALPPVSEHLTKS